MSPRRALTKAEQRLVDVLVDALSRRKAGTPLADSTASELGRLAKAMLGAPPDLVEQVGPVCATGDVTAWLGVSRQALHKALSEYRIVGVKSADKKWFYPTWQFSSGQLSATRIAPVLGRLRKTMSEIEAASWLVSTRSDLDNLTPAQWITSANPLDKLIAAARKETTRRQRAEGDVAGDAGTTWLPHSSEIETTSLL
ncbi:MAG: hypothetical protein Q4G30_05335 [Actinomycetaceae bacterium]|nr:hypothetical protein [Actinomycetaceae bacterium]